MKWVVDDGLDRRVVTGDSSELDRALEKLKEEDHKVAHVTAVLSCGHEVRFQYLLRKEVT